ncbi:hypothetical protein [Azonexus sp. R2A61]|uniref:hypothetical protein n=1 Tax=Azonexus sp. R2A61 TaxID=2744443 RepID=UPI001F48F76F|nr:hypothetical protein [Azonexus sp. R2A61]
MVWNTTDCRRWSQTEDDQLFAMVAEGKSAGAIAKAIDRSESSVYHRIEMLAGKPKAKKRHCMCCGREFASDGPHHRLCGSCRHRNLSPYAP